ncbi:unnamed protein product [Arabis nemorensis]|uniref:Translation elongation factor EF1B beta/delta subunit guanine nucleotide exchange domain-containing protein n=1 Tax=Arabis nemorensis TaxID=586526 RepID=A0A565BMM9_9BRAS|nr:unnamed protein product [Arabis nemorensis]
MKKLEENLRSIPMEGVIWGECKTKLIPIGYGVNLLWIISYTDEDHVYGDTLIDMYDDHVFGDCSSETSGLYECEFVLYTVR